MVVIVVDSHRLHEFLRGGALRLCPSVALSVAVPITERTAAAARMAISGIVTSCANGRGVKIDTTSYVTKKNSDTRIN